MNFSGCWFIIAFQTYFFAIAGISKSFRFTIMNTCLGLLGVFCGMYAIWQLAGRRVVCMVGYLACALCFLSMAIAGTVKATGNEVGDAIVAFVALYMFFYNGCLNSTSYTLATELVSSRLRVWTVGTATSFGCVLSWVTLFITPYFINPQDLNWVSASSNTIPINKLLILILHQRAPNTVISGLASILFTFYSTTFSFLKREIGRWKSWTSSSRSE